MKKMNPTPATTLEDIPGTVLNHMSAYLDNDSLCFFAQSRRTHLTAVHKEIQKRRGQPYLLNMSCGIDHNFLNTPVGIFAWGGNYDLLRQLLFPGPSVTKYQKIPARLTFPNNEKIIQIKASQNSSIALSAVGQVYSWGYNGYGQLGLGHYHNQRVPSPLIIPNEKILQIITRGYCSFALTKSGRWYTWGYNGLGQLGLGHTHSQHTPTPFVISNEEVVHIVVGMYHSFALTKSGQWYTWGSNDYGELGLGHIHNQHTPTPFNIPNEKILQIIAGSFHSFACTESGQWYTWGANDSGLLGLGHTHNQDTPTPFSIPSEKILQIIAGGSHSFALTESGKWYTWGANDSGQLGLGRIYNQHTPTPFNILNEKILQIIPGGSHSFAITESSRWYTWGGNWEAQLGLGDNTSHAFPVFHPKLTAIVANLRRPLLKLDMAAQVLNEKYKQEQQKLTNKGITIEEEKDPLAPQSEKPPQSNPKRQQNSGVEMKQTTGAKSATHKVAVTESKIAETESKEDSVKTVIKFSAEHITQISKLRDILLREIHSCWPYPNKARKQIKVNALNQLLQVNSQDNDMLLELTRLRVGNAENSEVFKGHYSKRTATLLNSILTELETHSLAPASLNQR